MEDGAQPVCKFHQTSHCKYGISCRLFHTKDTCTKIDCDLTSCTARHQRQCKYFFRKGQCSFEAECSYIFSVETLYIDRHYIFTVHLSTQGSDLVI